MGRTNGIILALGLLACIALSVMMQHLAGVAENRKSPEEFAQQIDEAFLGRLTAPTTYAEIELGGRPVAFVVVHPAEVVEDRAIAESTGAFVWRKRGRTAHLATVVVDCSRRGTPVTRFQVPPPGENPLPAVESKVEPVPQPTDPGAVPPRVR